MSEREVQSSEEQLKPAGSEPTAKEKMLKGSAWMTAEIGRASCRERV